MADMEAKTRAFLESQGHAWPAAPDPLLLLDGPLRRCSEALGRIVVQPDYFHTVAHVKVRVEEMRKLERAGVTRRFNAIRPRVELFYDRSTGVLKETEKLCIVSGTLTAPPTDADVHVRAIVERPKRDAVRFNVMWRRAFEQDWPYAADKTVHPWLQTAYDAQMQFYDKWRLPAGTFAVNWWNMMVANTTVTNYPGGRDIIGPVKDRIDLAYDAFIPSANRAWWEQHRQEVEAFVPPTCLAISCLLGRSAISPDWARGAVGSVVLVDEEHNAYLPTLYTALRGVIGYVAGKMADLDRVEGVADSLIYTMYLLDGFDLPGDFHFARFIVDRMPDKEFLVNWRRTHGRVWPEPQEALPPLVKAMLAEYMQIVTTTWGNAGQAVDAVFDDLLAQHVDRLAMMGVTYNDLDDLNRRACRRKLPEKAAPPQAARGPMRRMPEPVVEAPVSEIDKQIAEANRERSEQKKREKREKQGMVPALVQPAVQEHAQAERAQPVEAVNNKAHRKKTKQGQREAAAASKAAQQTQEQTRAFLKETAPAFREDVAAVAAEPSAQHLAREAARARHAQEAGDRRAAKAIVREDAERRVAEAFGL